VILRKSFPELNLNPFGFGLQWTDENGKPDVNKGIKSVRYVIQKERPDLWERYQKFERLGDIEKEILRYEFYSITYGHFDAWGAGGATYDDYAPYFKGSHIVALQEAFSKLQLNPLGFELEWKDEKGRPDVNKGIESVHFVVEKERPDLWERYQKFDTLEAGEKKALLNDFYSISSGHFRLWRVSAAMTYRTAPYFEGSH